MTALIIKWEWRDGFADCGVAALDPVSGSGGGIVLPAAESERGIPLEGRILPIGK